MGRNENPVMDMHDMSAGAPIFRNDSPSDYHMDNASLYDQPRSEEKSNKRGRGYKSEAETSFISASDYVLFGGLLIGIGLAKGGKSLGRFLYNAVTWPGTFIAPGPSRYKKEIGATED